jgi:hypothetical protein
MQAVVRIYSGANVKKLVAVFEERKQSIEDALREVDGFVSYSLVNTGDGAVSVTVFKNKAGTDESTRRAAEWVRENAPGLSVSAPALHQGNVIIHAS